LTTCTENPTLTKAFIEEHCQPCRHASDSRRWCCKWGLTLTTEARTPALTAMAKTLAIETVKHAVSGFKTRPPEDVDRITKLCQSCENIFYDDKHGLRCRLCGCAMTLKIKWATTRCPKQKW
jgi:hypothetical protein